MLMKAEILEESQNNWNDLFSIVIVLGVKLDDIGKKSVMKFRWSDWKEDGKHTKLGTKKCQDNNEWY